ncbi:MAG: DUF4823 domain-containing protein [Cellvibrionaceae bacterium]
MSKYNPYILLSLVLLCGCTSQYSLQATGKIIDMLQINDQYVFNERRGINLPINSNVYVAVANNVVASPFSPIMSHLLGQQLELYIPEVHVGLIAVSVSSALEQARQMESDFLIYPKIVLQSEQKSSFNEIVDDYESLAAIGLDRVWIQVSVWDVNSKTFIDSTQIKGRSTPVQFTENQSNDLIEKAMQKYAKRLMAKY